MTASSWLGAGLVELALEALDLGVLLGGESLCACSRRPSRSASSWACLGAVELGLEALDLGVLLAEGLLRLLGGLRDRELLGGVGTVDLVLQALDLSVLLCGSLLRLLGDLRLSELDLGLLGLVGLGEPSVEFLLELGRAHLLHEAGVLRLIDGEHGPAVRALDLVHLHVGSP